MADKRRSSRKQANLIVQGGVMAVTSLLVNACVLFCRIPLTVLWGDEGNGIYAAAYGGFFVFWLVSAYAVPVAVSGLLKSRLKRGQNQGAGMVIKIAFLYAAIVGLALSALLFLGSDYIAAHILPEPLAVLPIRVLSPALLFMSLSSVLRGFFLGSGAGFPVMLSFILEQVGAASGGILLAHIQEGYGIMVGALLQNESFSRSYAVMGFAGGISAGSLLAFLFLLGIYLLSHGYYKKRKGKGTGRKESGAQVIAAFFIALFPLILYGILTKGYVVVQQICFRLLMEDRMGQGTITLQWGMYDGKYKVLTMVPVLLATVMGFAVRERVHILCRRENQGGLRDFTQAALKAAMVIVTPLAVMVGTLGVPILNTCFSGQDTKVVSQLLLTGFITAVFFSAAWLLAEMLFGMGYVMPVLLGGIGAFALHLGAIYVMIQILELDLSGVLYGDILYSFLLLLFIGSAAKKRCGFRGSLLRSMLAPLIASAIMGGILYLLARVLTEVLPAGVLLAILAAVGMMIYILALLLLRGVTERELRLAPGGTWILAVGKALRML